MSGFIKWLEEKNKEDTRMKAVLRRSVAFEPGLFVPSYPYVEPFLKDNEDGWKRKVFYLVAGLWAIHWSEDRKGAPCSIGKASAAYKRASGSASIERRMISLLDSEYSQLPYRMRQMTLLLKDQSIDFEDLCKGLLHWNDEDMWTQTRWARDFYREIGNEDMVNANISGEDKI